MQTETFNLDNSCSENFNISATCDLNGLTQMQPWPAHWAGLKNELAWFKSLLNQRIESYFNEQHIDFDAISPGELHPELGCYYSALVVKHKLNSQQRLLVILAWVAEFVPYELDILLSRNKIHELPYTEFGGLGNRNQPGFIPTLQTAVFLLAGADVVAGLSVHSVLFGNDLVFSENILISTGQNEKTQPGEFGHHRLLQLSPQTRQQLLQGKSLLPEYGRQFPACKLQTQFEWSDLILSEATQTQLNELQLWLKHGDTLRHDWAMAKALNSGYKALFYGPPGTGKTLTAALLGKTLNQPVYRIDLSQLVSKYIGETQKNLERIFQTAEQYDWILFFDEADALFGKRTQVGNSNDRNANMETSFLLQRIEICSVLVILATNLKDNIDDAFIRRFQSIIHFANPGADERLKLWQQGFSEQADLAEVDCHKLAKQYELSGAEINNVIRYASLMALEYHGGKIGEKDLVCGIRREKAKSGKFV